MPNSTFVDAADTAFEQMVKSIHSTKTYKYAFKAFKYLATNYLYLERCAIDALKSYHDYPVILIAIGVLSYLTVVLLEVSFNTSLSVLLDITLTTRHRSNALVSCASASVLLRLTRRWVQSGQKFAGAPDIVGYLRIDAPHVLWALVILTLLDATYTIHERSFFKAGLQQFSSLFASTTLVVAALLFKVKFAQADEPEVFGKYLDLVTEAARVYTLGNLVTWARLVFLGIGLSCATTVYLHFHKHQKQMSFVEHLHPLLALLLITQSRLANIPLFFVFSTQLRILRRSPLQPIQISLLTILLAHVSFFAMGGTNSISTVDLSQAYNGIADYNISLVGILLFIGNWAGPIYWSTAGLVLLSQNRPTGSTATLFNAWLSHAELLTFWSATSVASVMAACLALRTHLFVWTVFSPKFLYAVAWAVGWHACVNVVLGGILAVMG